MLREERLKRQFPLWKFAARVPYPVSNITKIEKGLTEPRIGIALKMLVALGVDAGKFMQALAESQDWGEYETPEGIVGLQMGVTDGKCQSEEPPLEGGIKESYGAFLRQARLCARLTQVEVAARAGYTTRSLIAVENDKQEPMVMRGLQLVWVTGTRPRSFFGYLASLLRLPSEGGVVSSVR